MTDDRDTSPGTPAALASTLPPPGFQRPRGVGIYCMALRESKHGTPASFAEKARRYGVSWIAFLGVWQENGHTGVPDQHERPIYAEALRDQGIESWCWGYPTAGEEQTFVPALISAAKDCKARGVILDPEVSYKRKPEEMRDLLTFTIDEIDESLGLGFTSYGLAQAHGTFPWAVCGGYGWGSPQVYSVTPAVALRGIEHWRRLGWEYIVPSVPAFGPNSGHKLRDYLAGIGPHPAICVWSWESMDAREWPVLREYAEAIRQAA